MKIRTLPRRALLATALAVAALGAQAQPRSAWCAERCATAHLLRPAS